MPSSWTTGFTGKYERFSSYFITFLVDFTSFLTGIFGCCCAFAGISNNCGRCGCCGAIFGSQFFIRLARLSFLFDSCF